MNLHEVVIKQKQGSNSNTVELLDQDDVLNNKHISKERIEAEMLTQTQVSFSI